MFIRLTIIFGLISIYSTSVEQEATTNFSNQSYKKEIQVNRTDSSIAIINTKYGQLKFIRNCGKNSLVFYQSTNPIIDRDVEEEAFKRNISQDKMMLKICINVKGQIVAFSIFRKAKLVSLHIFITKLFNEVILEMAAGDDLLNCNCRESVYKIPLNYIRQRVSNKGN